MQNLLFVMMLLSALLVDSQTHSGVNLQPSYYNNGNITIGWETMKKYPQIKSLRIEVEPDKVEQANEWIREASSEDYDLILTYHKYEVLGSDDVEELMEAAEWWKNNYRQLSQAGKFVVNIMNEWGSHDQTPKSYSDAYNSAISVIRSVYSGPLILDIPGWGQETNTAIDASPLLLDDDIVFSAHIYPQSYNQVAGHYVTSSDVKDLLLLTGRPCIIGEFGGITSYEFRTDSNACDVEAVVQAAKDVGYKAVYGWAWNGDGGDMNMVRPSWTENPTSSQYVETDYFWPILELLG